MSKRPRPDHGDSPPTAACDQCRLRKVRCDRKQPECSNCHKAGVECSSSNSTKRVNQTKQLRDEFSIVLNQINHLDQSLGTLTSLTRQIAADVAKPPFHPPQPQRPGSFGPEESNYHDDPRGPGAHSANKNPPLETVEFDRGGEYLYSYPAPMVLIKSLLRQATESLLAFDEQRASQHYNQHNHDSLCHYFTALQDADTRAMLQQKLDAFPFKSPCVDFGLAKDTKAITTPPRLIVNASVDGYLRAFNTRTPIFDEDGLRREISAHYSADSPPQNGMAWPLITNAIVLLQLGIELRVAHTSKDNSHGINDRMLFPFLENCDRALQNLSSFTVPTVTNVKALIILTLVSREFFSNAAAERVCQAACQAGRALGLHRSKIRQDSGSTNGLTDTDKDRKRLFWALYTLDKQRVFMTGQPCDLYIFDSDHDIPASNDHDQPDYPLRDTLDHMMTIWEEIYLNLYSSKAASSNSPRGSRQLNHVRRLIKEFTDKHASHIANCSATSSESSNPLRIEFVYGCRVSQLLVFGSEQSTAKAQNEKVEIARSALQLILQVPQKSPTPAQLAALARMFRHHPIVAFTELIAFHLWHLFERGKYNTEAQADVSLLRAVCDRLQMLQLESLPHSFYARMKLGLTWALDTLQATGDIFSASQDPSAAPGFSRPVAPNHPSESISSTNSTHSSPFHIPNACGLVLNQAIDPPTFSSLNPRQDGLQSLVGENTGLVPEMERGGPTSQPLWPTYPFTSPSASAIHPQPEGSCAQSTNYFEWGDANMDFLEEFLAPGSQSA